MQIFPVKKEAEAIQKLPAAVFIEKMMYAEQEAAFYLLTEQGVERLDIKAKEPRTESLLSFTADALQVEKDAVPTDFSVGTDGRITVLYLLFGEETIRKELWRYETVGAETGEQVLTVTMPYEIELVNRAVKLYESKYPGRRVELETSYRDEEEYLEYSSAYTEKMTVKLLTGAYGDVLLSSHGIYSLDKLMTDTFVDVTDWVKTVDNYGNLDHGLLEAAMVDGTMRGVPVAISHSYYLANEALVQQADRDGNGMLTWSEMLDQAIAWEEQGVENNYLFGWESEYSLLNMLSANLYDLIDPVAKTMDLRQEWFLQLMEKWKEVDRNPHKGVPIPYADRGESRFDRSGMKDGAMLTQQQQMIEGKASQSLAQEARLFWENREESGLELRLLKGIAGEKNRNYDDFPILFFSVNPFGSQQQMALDFLEVLLSEEIQDRMDYQWSPVSRQARENRLVQAEKSGVPLSKERLEEYYRQLEETCSQVDWLYSYSYYLADLEQEMQEYVAGRCSLEEAVSRAEEKIWIRMNE